MKNIMKVAVFILMGSLFHSVLFADIHLVGGNKVDIQQIQQAIAENNKVNEPQLTSDSDRSLILSAILICSLIAKFKKLKKLLNQYIKTISSEDLKQLLKAVIEANKPEAAAFILEQPVMKKMRVPHLYEVFELAVGTQYGHLVQILLQQPQAQQFSLVELSKGLADAAIAQQNDMVHAIAAVLVTRTVVSS